MEVSGDHKFRGMVGSKNELEGIQLLYLEKGRTALAAAGRFQEIGGRRQKEMVVVRRELKPERVFLPNDDCVLMIQWQWPGRRDRQAWAAQSS